MVEGCSEGFRVVEVGCGSGEVVERQNGDWGDPSLGGGKTEQDGYGTEGGEGEKGKGGGNDDQVEVVYCFGVEEARCTWLTACWGMERVETRGKGRHRAAALIANTALSSPAIIESTLGE